MRAVALVLVAACGGSQHAEPPAFDAAALAAELDRITRDMADATRRLQADCPRLVDEIERLEARAADPIARARAAQRDPDQSRQLTLAARAYDKVAEGRSQAIGAALAACWTAHAELRDRVVHVVDSMPTL